MTLTEYLQICFVEELGEVAKAVSKCTRFGPNDINPITGVVNIVKVGEEFCEVIALMEMLDELGFKIETSHDLVDAKKQRLGTFINYSKSLGIIDDSNY